MSPPVVRASGVRVALEGNLVLDAVDVELREGAFMVLLGGNGSGKTTLVRALLGLAPVVRGRVELFGTPVATFRHWARIGYVPQRFSAAAGVPATVSEVVLSGRIARRGLLRRYTAADRGAARRALATLGLESLAGHRVATLSGGQQQRVLIARALAGDPELLVLDEPVSAVDLEHQDTLATTLSELKARGRSLLVVAHSLGAMTPLVDRAVTLELGRVVFDGPPGPEHAQGEHVHHDPAAPRSRAGADRAAGRPG